MFNETGCMLCFGIKIAFYALPIKIIHKKKLCPTTKRVGGEKNPPIIYFLTTKNTQETTKIWEKTKKMASSF